MTNRHIAEIRIRWNTADMNLLRDSVNGFYKGVIYFQKVDCFHGTRINVVSFTPIIKERSYRHLHCEAHKN